MATKPEEVGVESGEPLTGVGFKLEDGELKMVEAGGALAEDQPAEDEEAVAEEPAEEEAKAEEEPEEDGEEESAEAEEEEPEDEAQVSELETVDDLAQVLEVEPEDILDLKLKVGDEEVPLAELKNGYLRQADYTRKTQELADERRKLLDEMLPYAEVVARLKTDKAFADHVMRFFTEGPDAMPEVSEEEIEQLMEEDPDRARELIRQQKERKKRQQVLQQAQQQQMELLRQWAEEQTRLVKQQLPDLDEKRQDIVKYLKEVGFSDQEIASLVDARMIRVAYDAALGRKGGDRPRKALADKRRRPAPARGISAGADKPSGTERRRKEKALLKQARESRSMEDWARVIASRLEG